MRPLEDARAGMTVVTADGDKVGTVEDLKMGNPDAVTDQGQVPPPNEGIIANVAEVFDEEDVPEELAERLLRVGYLKIDNTGVFTGDRYIAADQVDRIDDDTIWLKPGYESVSS